MTTPTLYTGKQMLLDYYNKQKNMQLTLDDVVFGTPQRRDEEGALTNTWVRIYPAKGSGLTGAPKIYYDRVHMSYVGSIVVEKGTAIRTHDLLNKINEKYNTVFSEDDVENEILDPVAVGEIFVSLKIKEESVTYYDGDIIYTNRYPDPADLPQPEIEKMATWSIADSSINAVVTNAELTAEVNRSNMVVATLPLSAPKTYFEVKVETNGAIIGLARKDAAKTNASGVVIGGDNLSWGLNTSTGIFTHNGQTLTYCPPVPVGSTVGVLIDLTNGVLSYQVGSVMYGVAAIGLEQFSDLLPAACGTSASTQSKFTANFGQAPMTNTPPYDFRRGVYTVKQTMPNTGTGGYDVPDAGTLFDTYCKGQDLWGALADGEGGVVTTLLQASSFTCGAAANVVANLSVNPAELEIAKGTLAETTFTLSRGLEESVNFLVSATYEGLANQSYHGALQVRIGASALNNINGGKITIPAGDTSFIIRTMLTSGYVAQPGDIIKIKVEVEPTYAGLITNTGPVIVDIKLLNQSNLPAGTLISTYCNGFTNFGVFADGAGGTYEEVIEGNSEACGYVPFVLRTVRVTGTGTFDLPLGVDSVTIDGQGSEGSVSNYKIGGVPGEGKTQVIPFAIPGEELFQPDASNSVWHDEYLYIEATRGKIYRTKDFVDYEYMPEIVSIPKRCNAEYYVFRRIEKDGDPTRFTIDLQKTLDFVNFTPCLKGSQEYLFSQYTILITPREALSSSLRSYGEYWLIVNTTDLVHPDKTIPRKITTDGVTFRDFKDMNNVPIQLWNGISLITKNHLYILPDRDTTTKVTIFDRSGQSRGVIIPFDVTHEHAIEDETHYGVVFYQYVYNNDVRTYNNQSKFFIKYSKQDSSVQEYLDDSIKDIAVKGVTVSISNKTACFLYRRDAEGIFNSTTIYAITTDGVNYTEVNSADYSGVHNFFNIRDVVIARYVSGEIYFTDDLENWRYHGYSVLLKTTTGCIDKYIFSFLDTYDGIPYIALMENRKRLYETASDSLGAYSSVTIDQNKVLFQRGAGGVKPERQIKTISIDPATQTNISYICAGTTFMDISFVARKVQFPAAGTIVVSECVGYTSKQTQNNGNNGVITLTLEENSPACGYDYDYLKSIRLSGSNSYKLPKGTVSVKVTGAGGKLKPISFKQSETYLPFYIEKLPPATLIKTDFSINGYLEGEGTVFKGVSYFVNNYKLYSSTDRYNWFPLEVDTFLPDNITIYADTERITSVFVIENLLFITVDHQYDKTNSYGVSTSFAESSILKSEDGFAFEKIYSRSVFGTARYEFVPITSKLNDLTINIYSYNRINENINTNDLFVNTQQVNTEVYDSENDIKLYIDGYLFTNSKQAHVNGKNFFVITTQNLRRISTGAYFFSNYGYKTVCVYVENGTTFKLLTHLRGFCDQRSAATSYVTGASSVYYIDGKYISYYLNDAMVYVASVSTDLETWVTTQMSGYKLPGSKFEYSDVNFYGLDYYDNKLICFHNTSNDKDPLYLFYTEDGLNWHHHVVNDQSLGKSITNRGSYTRLGYGLYAHQNSMSLFKLRPVQAGETIIDQYAETGKDTYVSLNDKFVTFNGSSTAIPPVAEDVIIPLDSEKVYTLNYVVPEDGSLTIEYMGVDDNVPAPGTFISTACDGYTKTNILADGRGGQYVEIVEYNSEDCGYVKPVTMSAFYTRSTLVMKEGLSSKDMVYLSNPLDVDLDINITTTLNNPSVKLFYRETVNGSAIEINGSMPVTIPAGFSSFYMEVVSQTTPDEAVDISFSITYTPTSNANRLLPASVFTTGVTITNIDFVVVPAKFNLVTVRSDEAYILMDGLTGYTEGTAILMTETPILDGKHYFEIDNRDEFTTIGIIDASGEIQTNYSAIYPGSAINSWGFSSGFKIHEGVNTAYGSSWGTSKIGVSYDTTTGEFCLYIDGVNQGVGFVIPKTATLHIAIGSNSQNQYTFFSLNFGQRPLAYPQTGFNRGYGVVYEKGKEPVTSKPSDGYLTPTVLDPLTSGTGIVITNAGYLSTIGPRSVVKTKDPLTVGNWVWEAFPMKLSTVQNTLFGLMTVDHPVQSETDGVTYLGSDQYSWAISADGSKKYHNGIESPTGFGSRPQNIPMSLRFINNTKTLEVDIGGGYQTLFTDIAGTVYPAASTIGEVESAVHMNFGQMNFIQTIYDPYWRGVGIPTRNPFSSMIIRSFCDGFNYVNEYTDGSGGTYLETVESNSERCGFVLTSDFYESDNLTKVGFNNRDDTEATINLYEGPYTVFSKTTLNGQNYYFEVDTDAYSNAVLVGVGSKEQTLASGHPGEGENRIVIDMSTGTIHLGSGQTDNRFEADYATKLAGGLVGFYYEGATTKQVTLYFKDKTTVTLPYTINEAGNTIKMLVGIDAVDTYGVLVNQGQYEFGYTPPTGALRVSPALPEASNDWIDNGNGRIININKSSNGSIGTHAGKHTLLSTYILDEYKYMWVFSIPSDLEKPFYGIAMDGLVINNIDYKTAMGVTVIDTSTGSIYCDGVESQFPAGAWDDDIRNNSLAFLYDGAARTIKLYSGSGVTYDLPHPATSLPMRILVATTGYEDGLNYTYFNIGREDIYMNVPPGYGTVINPMIPVTSSLYWGGDRLTSSIKAYYEKEAFINSTPGYASLLSMSRIDGGKYYWETTHFETDTTLMVGVAEETLPATSIPGSAGHISIALDYATGNVIRSDGTIFNDLLPLFESGIKGRPIGMGYDNVNNAFVVIVDYQPYSFPLHAVPSTLHVVVGNGSNTEGITAAYINLGQDYFYHGLFGGFDRIEQNPDEAGEGGGF